MMFFRGAGDDGWRTLGDMEAVQLDIEPRHRPRAVELLGRSQVMVESPPDERIRALWNQWVDQGGIEQAIDGLRARQELDYAHYVREAAFGVMVRRVEIGEPWAEIEAELADDEEPAAPSP
jgi:hypothetical protein